LLRRLLAIFGREDETHAAWIRQRTEADIAFDTANGTTTGDVQELFELNIVRDGARYGVSHIASDPNAFLQMTGRLNVGFSNCTFVDLG